LIKPITTALDILSYPLLQIEGRSGDWGRWLTHHGQPNLRPPAMLFDQFATMIQGAVHGLGIALVPSFLITREQAEGTLVPVFGAPLKSISSYYLVWPKDNPQRGPLLSFQSWLVTQI
jgi:DNA-binding transcriptional LysR family regulator